MNIASLIDHTLLKPTATAAEIDQLCQEALQHQFCSVCVNPIYVRAAAAFLHNTPVKVCTVIGFPLGANLIETKAIETRAALRDGAREVDMVLNLGALKDGKIATVRTDIEAIAQLCQSAGAISKVIFETKPSISSSSRIFMHFFKKHVEQFFEKFCVSFRKSIRQIVSRYAAKTKMIEPM